MTSSCMSDTVLPCFMCSMLPAIKERHFIDLFRFDIILQCNVCLTLHKMNSTCNGDFYWCVQCALNFWWVITQKKRQFAYLCGCWITHYSMKHLLHNRNGGWVLGDSRFRMRGICPLLNTKPVTSVTPGSSEFSFIYSTFFLKMYQAYF
jgi:hypothetical protein